MDHQQNNLYNQQPTGQMPMSGPMPPPPTPNQPGQTPLERRRMMAQNDVRNAANGVMSFPKWVTQYGVMAYILALAVVSLMYNAYSLPWYYMLSGVTGVVAIFLFGSYMAERLSPLRVHKEKIFKQRIFLIAFIPRIVWMLLIYNLFMQNYGDSFGFEHGDAEYYDLLGKYVSGLISSVSITSRV